MRVVLSGDRTTASIAGAAIKNYFDVCIVSIPSLVRVSTCCRKVLRTGFAAAQDDIAQKQFRDASNCDL